MTMAAPPPGQFAGREELLEYMKDWAEGQGYAVVIGRSRANRLWIKCDRGGKYEDKHADHPENRKRKRGESRLTDCPFKVLANVKRDGIWRCRTEIADHNHPPSEDLSVHPSLRRMTDEQLEKVREMTEVGNTPVETLEELQRLWPGIKVLRRDIYNARKKYKTEKEIADAAQGLHLPRPYQDPNGIMPGPTATGRWEWLEEGDEIKRKKRKKLSFPVQQMPLAPELREADLSMERQGVTRREHSLLPTGFLPAQPTSAVQRQSVITGNGDHSVLISPVRSRSYNPTAGAHQVTTTPTQQGLVEGLAAQVPPPPRFTDITDTIASGSAPNGASTAQKSVPPSGQVLMSRMERMEKEQKEQKDLLAKILGAVQGIR
jgi:hypothetical protein